jgi:hypothetical protein
MLKILNEYYYLDLDKMDEMVNLSNKNKSEDDDDGDDDNDTQEFVGQHISVVKYDMLKVMIEVLMTESEEVDEKLGPKSSELSIPFKLAFNTLINKQIINKY